MLTFYVGTCLFAKRFNRPPTAAEAARIRATVDSLYEELNQSQPESARAALEHLRTGSGVAEVLDVALSAQVTEPSSFIVDSTSLMEHLKTHRAVVVPAVGCLVLADGRVHLVNERESVAITKHRLHDLFKTCHPVVVLQQ